MEINKRHVNKEIDSNIDFKSKKSDSHINSTNEDNQIASHNNMKANEALTNRGKALLFKGEESDVISSKAITMLNQNDCKDYQPLKTIVSDTERISDIFDIFQRKLAIDRMQNNNTGKNIYENGKLKAAIEYNESGKPEKITHYKDSKTKYIQTFDYVQKRDGSFVLSSENIFEETDGKKNLIDTIKYYKHHNGDVTISTSKGQTLSYDLRHNKIYDVRHAQPVTSDSEKREETPIVKPPIKKELFIRPQTNYPKSDYDIHQKRAIKSKFEVLKNNINTYGYQFDTRAKDLDRLKELVLNVKDPKLQEALYKSIMKLEDWNIPSTHNGTWSRLDLMDETSGFEKIGHILLLDNCLRNDYITVDGNGYPRKNGPSFNIFDEDYRENERFVERLKTVIDHKIDVDTGNEISADIHNSDIEKEKYAIQMENIGSAILWVKRDFPELEQYLYDNYYIGSLDEKRAKAVKQISDAKGERIYLQTYGIMNYKSLDNFANLPEETKQQFLKNPTLLKKYYLDNSERNDIYGLSTPFSVISGLTKEDWEKFNQRGLNDKIDIICGIERSRLGGVHVGSEIKQVLDMDDETWKKVIDFKLFELKDKTERIFSFKNQDLLFCFDDIMQIVNTVTYKDWEKINKRGILDIKPTEKYSINNADKNNGQRHIGVKIMSALAKAPDSTYNFLTNKLNLVKDDRLNLTLYKNSTQESYIAKGIDYLSHSQNYVYDIMLDLKNAGLNPGISMEILGVGVENYGKFGRDLRDRVIELKEKNIAETEIPEILPLYSDLQFVKNKSNINELSISEKRLLLKNLTKYNSAFFNLDFKSLLDSDIIPKNKDEYCALLPKLVKSVGIDTRPVNREIISNYDRAMSAMSEPNSEFLTTAIKKDTFKLELDYSRRDFINDILNKVSVLPDNEKMKVYDYFGFEIKIDNNDVLQMNGYPVNINNGAKLAEISDEKTKAIIEEVRPYVEKFTNTDNKICVKGKPQLTKQLNDVVTLFPEFKSIIGKVQHGTHDYTVDVHILKVLQRVMSNPEYNRLSDNDKRLLNIATLMHDLTKTEKSIDKTHPQFSAFDTYYILDKMNMPEKDKIKIYQLIKNHDWLERYNKKVHVANGIYREKTPEERLKVAKDIAFEMRDGENFKMASILAEADTKGVKESGEFFNKYRSALIQGEYEIAKLVNQLQSTAIHLPQTKIPKASELRIDNKNTYMIKTRDSAGNSIDNTVLYLRPNMDLGEVGFEKGLKSDDFNIIVHGLEKDTQASILQALGQIDSDALLSTSYVTYSKGNYHVFRPQGFILDIGSSDIHAGTYKDFGSGYGKDLDTLKSQYLFGASRHHVRDFIPDKLKKKLNIGNNEYIDVFKKIADKTITDLDKENPEISKAYREMFNEMEIHKRRYGRDYNEFLVSRPKIQGVFFEGYGKRVEDIPEFLRKYAQENDLPIIFLGE